MFWVLRSHSLVDSASQNRLIRRDSVFAFCSTALDERWFPFYSFQICAPPPDNHFCCLSLLCFIRGLESPSSEPHHDAGSLCRRTPNTPAHDTWAGLEYPSCHTCLKTQYTAYKLWILPFCKSKGTYQFVISLREITRNQAVTFSCRKL